jgi:vancomycin permeability regulator SanA
VPEAVLLTVDGLQVPVMLLDDVVGKAGTEPPLQIVNVVPNAKVGVILGLTVTVNVVFVAHCPAVGVNV